MQISGARLYVGNLPSETAEEDLRSVLEAAGIDAGNIHMPVDEISHTRRGFAIVQLDGMEQALQAIDHLEGHEIGGRRLTLETAPGRIRRPNYVGERGEH